MAYIAGLVLFFTLWVVVTVSFKVLNVDEDKINHFFKLNN